jgi:putative membrane-bound dehydrogenase-like protein
MAAVFSSKKSLKVRHMLKLISFLALFVGLCICSRSFSAEATYRVGVAKVDITPDYPIRLNGFGFRREESEGVSQHVWAKALAISVADEPPAVIITIDNLGVRLPMVDAVAKRLDEKFQIPREKVALTFSHSHCAPKVNGASDNIFSQAIPPAHQEHIDRYTKQLTNWLVDAATAAINDRKPATIARSVGKVGFAKNRRPQGGPVDHDMPILVIRDPSGEPRAIYFSYACHCVTLSFNKISGDWSGYAQELIERRFPGVTALASIGCGSDSNPSSGVTGDKTDIAATQGAEIADEVARLLKAPLTEVSGPITARMNRIDLPLNDLPTREQWVELSQKQGAAAYNAQTQLARLDRGEKLQTSLTYPIQSITFGDSLHMVFLAGEVCVDYSQRLKKELDRSRIWLNAYSNDFGAYIPSERLVKEGGYGGGAETPYFALPSTLRAGLEQPIVDEVKRLTPASFIVGSGTNGVAPKSPEKALQSFKTHDDLKIELVAAEPLVTDPVAIDFGPDGRLWVVEMTDYARGVNEEFAPQGSVRFLTDTNADGQFDKATEFITGLRFPTDVKVWRQGVLICDAPEIMYAEDTDGDGRADVRKTLFTGFATHNAHARVNSLRYALDNWVYGSGGLFGGRIKSFAGQTVDVTNRDFRMNPDTGAIEPVNGYTQQGRPRDDWDNWFGCTNGELLKHYVVEDRYARRNPHVPPPPLSRHVADFPNSERLFPQGELVLFKLSGPPGLPTAACGLEVYRDDWLGPQYYGNAFTCEPVNQLVHRLLLNRKGATFSGRRAPEEQSSEFLSSNDQWFRPVQIRTGLDGAIWVVDMYRYLIEHPQWIPPEVVAELNIFAGQNQGRIYRLVPKDRGPRSVPRLDQLDNEQLAAAMDSTNGTQRDLVQQMLIWREAKDTAPQLEQIARRSSSPAARLQAAATLAGLQELKPDTLAYFFDHPQAELRRHAIRLIEPLINKSPGVVDALLPLVNDPDLIVRVQLAQTFGERRDDHSAKALATLAQQAGDEPYLAAAVLSSTRTDNIVPVVRAYMAGSNGKPLGKMADSLLTVAAASGDESIVGTVIEQIASDSLQVDAAWRWRTLAHVLKASERRHLDVGKMLTGAARTTVLAMFEAASTTANAPDSAEANRLAAIELLGSSSASVAPVVNKVQNIEVLARLTSADQPPAIQSAAVQALSHMTADAISELLLSQWQMATPRLHDEMLDVLLSRDNWAKKVLDGIAGGTLKANELGAARRERLLAHRNSDIRQRANQVLNTPTNSSRKQLIKDWQAVATTTGDKRKGQDVFRRRCANCHQLDGIGTNVGPDLAALTNKSSSALLVAILDPNRDVDGRYINYVAVPGDGRTLVGMLVSESGNSITLREPGGKDHVLLRQELQISATGKSVMPEGLENDLSKTEMADVIAYVLEPRIRPKSFPGNQPGIASPDKQGVIALLAEKAEIYGGEIAFESTSPYRNIGYWHGVDDFVGWQIQLTGPGLFDVYLDYSCAPESAGNGFRIEGGEPSLQGIVQSTGDWSTYRRIRVGTIELNAGQNYLSVKCDGTKQRPALLDLREVQLVPASGTARLVATAPEQPSKADGAAIAAIAEQILDDKQSAEKRQQLIAEHARRSAPLITAMATDIRGDVKEEYRRIPWIWRVAIAAGKRNDADELRSILEVSLPSGGQPLRHWQAVVIGGGIINGVSLSGAWPKSRIEEAIKVDGILVARWQKTIEQAVLMADDEKVPTGTRYDALRIIAMGPWDLRGAQMQKYLAAGIHEELQMGAVSGTADMQSAPATKALLDSLKHLAQKNRELALDGLLRSADRCQALLDAIDRGAVDAKSLGDARSERLLKHSDAAVRQRAEKVLGK